MLLQLLLLLLLPIVACRREERPDSKPNLMERAVPPLLPAVAAPPIRPLLSAGYFALAKALVTAMAPRLHVAAAALIVPSRPCGCAGGHQSNPPHREIPHPLPQSRQKTHLAPLRSCRRYSLGSSGSVRRRRGE